LILTFELIICPPLPGCGGFSNRTGRLIIGDNLLPKSHSPDPGGFLRRTEKSYPPNMIDRKDLRLRAYLRSLKRLQALGRAFPKMIVLLRTVFLRKPLAHDELENRSAEIIEHHVQRCAPSRLLNNGPMTLEQIVWRISNQLIDRDSVQLAENEVRSH